MEGMDYGIITLNPKMAKLSIISAGIIVIMDSFDMKLLIHTWY